jgi:histidyl-tRNA synthetase
VATALRDADRRVDLVLEPRKTKWVFKHADRLGARYVVLLAPDEAARGSVRVKRLSDSEQYDVRLEDLVQWMVAASGEGGDDQTSPVA